MVENQKYFFRGDGKTKTLPRDEKIHRRVIFTCLSRSLDVSELLADAYSFTQEKHKRELTKEGLNEYLANLDIKENIDVKDIGPFFDDKRYPL